ncbi:unnamed protein product [Caenorhabditis auriculariae]|uniref:Uncharacterized protein n=1 Tax=Caenorhabditis auriculariae TaxID=2777116 RepID=A0A8S1HWM6_9PELO|nr:unnamed protein product [Caenorhabditis auriculariae]
MSYPTGQVFYPAQPVYGAPTYIQQPGYDYKQPYNGYQQPPSNPCGCCECCGCCCTSIFACCICILDELVARGMALCVAVELRLLEAAPDA